MCEGGIYDHLGGGFSRYSVDERWLVPHFEKMLYDNAQLIELLALAHERTGKLLFATRARETVAWLAREMTTPGGAFAASLDADSEGEEGKFYVWSLAEIEQVLGTDDAAFFARHYDVTASGNFEGHNILNRLQREPTDAATESRARRAARSAARACATRRVRPGLDDKVLADWNGLMIAGLVNAGLLLDEPDWIDMARRAFDFIAARDDARRPARPFLARRQAAVSRPRLRLRRHDPRRARAARGDRRARLSRPRDRLAGARSTATTPTRPAATTSRPTTPKAWWCGRSRPPTTRCRIRTG